MFAASCSAADAMDYLFRVSAGRSAPINRRRGDHGNASAGFLDGLDRGLRSPGNSDIYLGLQGTLCKQADTVTGGLDETCLLQRCCVHRLLGIEAPGIDGRLQAAQVHHLEGLGKDVVVEATLGQAPMQRHLATLEALDGNTGTRLLALMAVTGGLALAGTDPAPDALAALGGTLIVA